jgi:CPA2 family monovalent cation:H+ antiporter-2
VGLLIDPALVARHWVPVVIFTLVVLAGKVASVALGAFLSGAGLRTAVQSGMSLAQIGEFSFIIAGLGLSLGATRDFLYPVMVAVSAITTLTTPWLVRASGPAAALVDRKLPRSLQTLVSLHGAWLERLKGGPSGVTQTQTRTLLLLCGDTLLLILLIIGLSLGMDRMASKLQVALGLGPASGRVALILGALALAVPLLLGMGRLSHRLGNTLASRALPRDPGRVDLDAPPRQMLTVILQLSIALLAGVAVLLATGPFLPGYVGPAILAVLLLIFGLAIWRSAANLESHVRAGAEAIVESLARHARSGGARLGGDPLMEIRKLVAGFGDPVVVRIEPGSSGQGRTLRELNLRGRTGATILAIARPEGSIVSPSALERLREGDVLALVGTHEAIEMARAALR